MPTTNKLSQDIILAAIEGFESQKLRIDTQIAELRQLLTGGSVETPSTPQARQGRRKLSAAARARIAEAQRKRWAKTRADSAPAETAVVAPKPKRKLSAAGRRAIIEATKRRWALVRAAKAAENEQAAPRKTSSKAAKKAGRKATKKASKRAQKAGEGIATE